MNPWIYQGHQGHPGHPSHQGYPGHQGRQRTEALIQQGDCTMTSAEQRVNANVVWCLVIGQCQETHNIINLCALFNAKLA